MFLNTLDSNALFKFSPNGIPHFTSNTIHFHLSCMFHLMWSLSKHVTFKPSYLIAVSLVLSLLFASDLPQ